MNDPLALDLSRAFVEEPATATSPSASRDRDRDENDLQTNKTVRNHAGSFPH